MCPRSLVKKLALGVLVLVAATVIAGASYRWYRQPQFAQKLVIASDHGIDEQHFADREFKAPLRRSSICVRPRVCAAVHRVCTLARSARLRRRHRTFGAHKPQQR